MRTAVPRPATAAAGPLQAAIVTPAEESLRVAILLSLAGGFLDAFTWIAHFVAGWIDKHDPVARRQAKILVLVCFTFALGAGVGAVLTRSLESNALLVPIALLLAALTLCGRPLRRDSDIRGATHG